MANKHPHPSDQPADLSDDLEENPGIGQSKGMFAHERGREAELLEGDNTTEGDAENDGGDAGGVSLELGRTNK